MRMRSARTATALALAGSLFGVPAGAQLPLEPRVFSAYYELDDPDVDRTVTIPQPFALAPNTVWTQRPAVPSDVVQLPSTADGIRACIESGAPCAGADAFAVPWGSTITVDLATNDLSTHVTSCEPRYELVEVPPAAASRVTLSPAGALTFTAASSAATSGTFSHPDAPDGPAVAYGDAVSYRVVCQGAPGVTSSSATVALVSSLLVTTVAPGLPADQECSYSHTYAIEISVGFLGAWFDNEVDVVNFGVNGVVPPNKITSIDAQGDGWGVYVGVGAAIPIGGQDGSAKLPCDAYDAAKDAGSLSVGFNFVGVQATAVVQGLAGWIYFSTGGGHSMWVPVRAGVGLVGAGIGSSSYQDAKPNDDWFNYSVQG
jgi:hypothetical protein